MCASLQFDWLWASDSKVNENESSKLEVKNRRRKRAQRLLRHKRHFVPMLLAAIPWDFVLFFIWLGYGPSHLIDPIVLDVIQGLRLMRCAIAIMSNEHFSVIVGALNLGWTAVEMSKMAVRKVWGDCGAAVRRALTGSGGGGTDLVLLSHQHGRGHSVLLGPRGAAL